jgi:hypothetical protein
MNLEILETADQVFDALGGNQGVAELTESKPSRVSNWRICGSFPANFYVLMTDALRSRGKTAPASLWRMREAAEAS